MDCQIGYADTNSLYLHNLVFKYAQEGILIDCGGIDPDVNVLRDIQFVDCAAPFSCWDTTNDLQNILIAGVSANAVAPYGGAAFSATDSSLSIENLTAHNVASLWQDSASRLAITNSLLITVTNLGAAFTGANNATSGSDAGIFQSQGGGTHYLPSGSPYRNQGTAHVDPGLLADLAEKTTYPPVLYSNLTIVTNLALAPTVPRDTNASVDLGYHYDPIDFLLGQVSISNINLTISPGTVIGCFGLNNESWTYALNLAGSASFNSQGLANDPVRFAEYATVQESCPSTNWCGGSQSYLDGILDSQGVGSTITCQFTDWSCLQWDLQHAATLRSLINLRDCQFQNGSTLFNADTTNMIVNSTNCLYVRTDNSWGIGNPSVVRNNTFWGGAFDLVVGPLTRHGPVLATKSVVKDNIFDQCSVEFFGYTNYGHNAYVATTNISDSVATEIILTNPVAYQAGPLGNFYLPPGSPLIQAGSTTANLLGLYEYTTQTNQTKETNAIVDIGFHYVATDADGNPLDTLWTGIPDYLADTNGSGGLEAWELEYFGQLGLNPTASDDGQGGTLLADFQDGVYPNDVSFTLASTNDYFRMSGAANCYAVSPGASIQLALSSGIPGYIAVSVDDTNYVNDAVWQQFEGTNISVNLGTTQGWHDVWVGLQGPATNAQVTWEWKRLKLDSTPPLLVVTNPVGGTVSVPIVQLQGYSPKALSQISYNLDNALGEVTNQPVLVTSQLYSTNSGEYLTNTFQAFDIPLTNGVNTVTLFATDLAGNLMTTNLTFTLNYAGKPAPTVQLFWPQNGTLIGNSSYTWRGWVSDPTATVLAQVSDSAGNINVLNGLVERNGNFWVEDIPMTNGVNSLLLTVTDAAGNVTTTNITVSPETVALTIDAPSSDDLWNQSLTVTGTIGDSSDYTVWVNGVEATINGDGTWTADNVYLTTDGTAVFQARAIPNSDNGGLGTGGSGGGPVTEAGLGNPTASQATDAEVQLNKPPRLFVSDYDDLETGGNVETGKFSPTASTYTWPGDVWSYDSEEGTLFGNWTDGQGGYSYWSWQGIENSNLGNITNEDSTQVTFKHTLWPDVEILSDDSTLDSGDGYIWPTMEHCAIGQPVIDNSGVYMVPPYGEETATLRATEKDTENRHAQATMHLQTGGKGTIQKQALFQITASASQIFCVQWPVPHDTPFPSTPAPQIPPHNIHILGQALGSDGNLWVVLPDDETIDVTPQIKGVDYYLFNENQQKYKLYVEANSTPLQPDHVVRNAKSFCVGQSMGFSPLWRPEQPPFSYAQAVWTLPGTFVNYQPYAATCPDYYADNTQLLTLDYSLSPSLTTYCWYAVGITGGDANLKINMTFPNGQQVSLPQDGLFTVVHPFVRKWTYTNMGSAEVMILSGYLSAGNYLYNSNGMSFIAEVSTPTTGVAGFTQLISGEYQSTLPFSTDGYELDGCGAEWIRGPYNVFPGLPEGDNQVFFDDQPHVSLATGTSTNTSFSYSFETYLRFKSYEAGPLPNIFITMDKITWSANAYASYTGSSGWQVDSGSDITGPNLESSSEFPIYTEFFCPPYR